MKQNRERLSHRKRVQLALNHQEPDCVPIDFGEGRACTTFPGPYSEAANILGVNIGPIHVSRRGLVDEFDENLLKALDIDFRRLKLRYPAQSKSFDSSRTNIDEWGIPWEYTGTFWESRQAPLKNANIDDLENYPWPEPIGADYVRGLREEAEHKYQHTDYALVACLPQHCYGIMTTAYLMRGLDIFMMDLIENREFIDRLFDKILSVHQQVYTQFLETVGEFVEVVQTGDDMGTQNGPFFSPEMYREIVQPKQKALLQHIKNFTQAKIFFHSCGSVYKLLPHMIDAGIDILNPVQHTAKDMELVRLKHEFGDQISFQGGVDQQQILTFVTSDDVKLEVAHCLESLSPGGGYVLTAVHNIAPEVSGQNLVDMYKFARNLGMYH